MKRLGFLGAFSIDNPGDALVGYAGRQALRALVPDAEQVTFAPAFPHPFWGHATDRARGIDTELVAVPASTDMSFARDVDALIIGGGGIINLDPAFRPFLLGDPERYDGPPAAWNGVCSQNQPYYAAEHAATYEAVRRCCERLRRVAVRNRTTATFVRRCGYEGPLHVIPDPTLLLDVPAGVEGAVDALLDELGVDRGRPTAGVSLGPALLDERTRRFFGELFVALRRLPAQLVVFPFGPVHGDDQLVDAVAAELPGARAVRRRLAPLEVWRLVGRMSFYVGCRFHAVLAAFAQDVPFVVLDEYLSDQMASSKTREFIADTGLEPHYLCPFLPGSPAWKVENLFAARAAVSFARRREELRARLRAHYAELVAALGC